VSRFWDRITRPEQLLAALPAALSVLLDPVTSGPATIAFSQDVQAEAAEFPAAFFARRLHRIRRPGPDMSELDDVTARLRGARAPLIVAGGGVLYSEASKALDDFSRTTGIPVAETQAGKGALAWDHPHMVGAIGVTGGAAANTLAREADLVLAVGTRLQDFTSGSRALFGRDGVQLVQLNVAPHDATKHGALALVADARVALDALGTRLRGWRADETRPGPRRRVAGARRGDHVARPGRSQTAERCRDPWCGEPLRGTGDHHPLRGRRFARRVAQALARHGTWQLPP
jgi:3D-(3,5/4)-trihydroxycyclohexane-1,2-dione acylhydrolase (decyclizing)